MTSNRPARIVRFVAAAIATILAVAAAGCGGGGGAQLSEADLRSNVPEGVEIDADQPPEQLADKDIPTACANDLGTGDPAFEAAFCAYRDARSRATSGPDGVSGIDPSLLSAGDDALRAASRAIRPQRWPCSSRPRRTSAPDLPRPQGQRSVRDGTRRSRRHPRRRDSPPPTGTARAPFGCRVDR